MTPECKIRIVHRYIDEGGDVRKSSQLISDIDGTVDKAKLYEFAERMSALGSREFVGCYKIDEEELMEAYN